ncbi:MAG: tRNA (cytidine(56)-2'-O)-methyltransferase [Candidatus Hadarchaeota archaeon]
MTRAVVLRLGHRLERDWRVSTHVGLVARAFGADGLILCGRKDSAVEDSIKKVVEKWGGPFFVRSGMGWEKEVEKWKSEGGLLVHLTMYGLPLDEVVGKIRGKNIMVVVGAEKVPGKLFGFADFNVAVGNQPHSEVAALAVFLDRLFEGSELKNKFKKAKLNVVPSEKGKKVEKVG